VGNLLLEKVEYQVERTARGTWRRYLYPTGARFEEFRSHARWFGLPMVHYTYGICPETGRRIVAKGVVAVGRLAAGVIAVGHASFGVVALGQLALGLVLGLGQASTGLFALGQLAIALVLGLGQLATGYVTVAQLAAGQYVLAQLGLGAHVWDTRAADPAAVAFFRAAARSLGL